MAFLREKNFLEKVFLNFTWKIVKLPPVLHGFRWEICSQSNWYCLWVMCSFCLAAFKISFLSLFIRSLIIMRLGMHFFVFILFGVCSASWIYRSTSFTKLGKFLALMFLHFFSSIFFLSFLESYDVNIGSSVVVPQISEVLFIFFYSLFNCCYSYFVNSVDPFSSSLILSSVINLLLISSSDF